MAKDHIKVDSTEGFTEKLLRDALGERCTDGIVAAVKQAESTLLARKTSLAEMFDAGIFTPAEFADKVNAVATAYVRAVADLVGEETCKNLYDFDPADDVVLVDRSRVGLASSKHGVISIAQICADELQIAADRIESIEADEILRTSLREIIRHVEAMGDLADFEGGNRQAFLCWQTASITTFMAAVLKGDGVSDVVWRIAEKMLALDQLSLRPTPTSKSELFEVVQSEADAVGHIVDSGPEDGFEMSKAAQWLFDHSATSTS